MRERYFYKTDGTRTKVPLPEYSRRKKIQAKAIERAGNKVWEDRRGRAISVTPERLGRLEAKRETAKRAKSLGWPLIRQTKKAAKKGKREGLKVREYPGPSMTIQSTLDEGRFHAQLLDLAKIAIREDGRMGFLAVTAQVKSAVFSPDDPTGEGGNQSSVELYAVKDQKIMRVDKEGASKSLGMLTKGVVGLERKSPPKHDPAREVVPGKVISGKRPKDETGPRFADAGYWAEYTSVIFIRGVTR